jgi:hypothetical protein
MSPQIRKIPALLGLNDLNGAVIAVQENARAIGLFLQGQPSTIFGQARESLDEIMFVQFQKLREPSDLGFCQAHLPRPATAGCATLTLVKDRHGGTIPGKRAYAKEQAWTLRIRRGFFH